MKTLNQLVSVITRRRLRKIELLNDIVNDNKTNKYYQLYRGLRDNKISKTFRDPAGALTKSIYGCALSHKLAYEDFLKTDDSVKTALILEDDAALTHTGLRIMLPNSDGYAKLEDDIETIDFCKSGDFPAAQPIQMSD